MTSNNHSANHNYNELTQLKDWLSLHDNPQQFLTTIESEILSERVVGIYHKWLFDFLCSRGPEQLHRYNLDGRRMRGKDINTRHLFQLFTDYNKDSGVDIVNSKCLSIYLRQTIGCHYRESDGRNITVFPTLSKCRKAFAKSVLQNEHFDWSKYEKD